MQRLRSLGSGVFYRLVQEEVVLSEEMDRSRVGLGLDLRGIAWNSRKPTLRLCEEPRHLDI